MRHWKVTDNNHQHYLVLAESEDEALKKLTDWLMGSYEDYDELAVFETSPVPEVACIDDDSGIEFYPPPLSSER